MKYLFCISLILSNALHAQKTWYEAYFESTEYGKKKDRNDGPFKSYDYVWAQPNGLYVVKKKVFVKDSIPSLNSFLVDKNGKILTKRVYTDMGDFSEGMVEVTIGAENYCRGCFHTDRYSYLSEANVASGFINEKGEIAALGKGLYKFEYPDKSWGITDSLGNVWKGKQYDSISDRFKRGYLQVFQGTKTGLFDEKGEEVLPPEFDKIGVSAYGRILSEKEVFQYVFDQNGNHLEKSYQAGFLYKLLGATMAAGMISIGFWIYREGKSS